MTFETVTIDDNGFPIPHLPSSKAAKDVWDCIDPCAFVCYAVQTNMLPLDAKVKETLDNFGWLTKDGFPDYSLMRREFERNR